MGKSKSVPDLASKPMVSWTIDDVKQWLKEHESLNKYTKQLKVGSCSPDLEHRTVDDLNNICATPRLDLLKSTAPSAVDSAYDQA